MGNSGLRLCFGVRACVHLPWTGYGRAAVVEEGVKERVSVPPYENT